jgi:hypothetical protein
MPDCQTRRKYFIERTSLFSKFDLIQSRSARGYLFRYLSLKKTPQTNPRIVATKTILNPSTVMGILSVLTKKLLTVVPAEIKPGVTGLTTSMIIALSTVHTKTESPWEVECRTILFVFN